MNIIKTLCLLSTAFCALSLYGSFPHISPRRARLNQEFDQLNRADTAQARTRRVRVVINSAMANYHQEIEVAERAEQKVIDKLQNAAQDIDNFIRDLLVLGDIDASIIFARQKVF